MIIYTEWPGQAPQIVQDQVTYPITTRMLSVPRNKVVRGYSFYGFSFVYVIFEDGTDPYWARSRVLEYLSSLGSQLPKNVTPALGPDATGVGWAFMYSLNSTNRSLAELRSMQDWYLKYQLTAVEGVAEVASVGGFVKQYQVTVDPTKLRAYNLSLADVSMAVQRSNGEVGGRSIEMGEKEFILRVRGYIQGLDDLKKVAVSVGANGVPILLGQVANVQLGPDMRRGIAEWNGEGETVGGVVVVRYGANARQVIRDVKQRLDEAMKGLAAGCDVFHRLRPQRAYPARRPDAGGEAAGGKPRRGAGLPAVPAPFPQRVGGHPDPAHRGADFLRCHVRAGHQLQHHVTGRHCHRYRRDGGRGHHHDRERP